MSTCFSIVRSNDPEDFSATATIEKQTMHFSTFIYTGRPELMAVVGALRDFLSSKRAQLMSREVEGDLAPGMPVTAGKCRIACSMEATGKLTVRCELAAMSNGSTRLCDACVVNFSTDLAAFDTFLDSLEAVADGQGDRAELRGYDYFGE